MTIIVDKILCKHGSLYCISTPKSRVIQKLNRDCLFGSMLWPFQFFTEGTTSKAFIIGLLQTELGNNCGKYCDVIFVIDGINFQLVLNESRNTFQNGQSFLGLMVFFVFMVLKIHSRFRVRRRLKLLERVWYKFPGVLIPREASNLLLFPAPAASQGAFSFFGHVTQRSRRDTRQAAGFFGSILLKFNGSVLMGFTVWLPTANLVSQFPKPPTMLPNQKVLDRFCYKFVKPLELRPEPAVGGVVSLAVGLRFYYFFHHRGHRELRGAVCFSAAKNAKEREEDIQNSKFKIINCFIRSVAKHYKVKFQHGFPLISKVIFGSHQTGTTPWSAVSDVPASSGNVYNPTYANRMRRTYGFYFEKKVS